jgi:uncharacterized protein (DUF1697 family)
MDSWVALLRAINVGGKRKVPMDRLRQVVAGLGHDRVSTYIQSGNVLFRSASVDRAALEGALAEAFGFAIPVVVRTRGEVDALLGADPFPEVVDDTRIGVALLADQPAVEAIASLDADRSPPDVFRVIGREVWMHCPNGFGQSKLTNEWFERRLGTVATSRNRRTMKILAQLLADLDQS